MRRCVLLMAAALFVTVGCGRRTEVSALLPDDAGPGRANAEQMLQNFEEEYPQFVVDATWVPESLLAERGRIRDYDVVALPSACVPAAARAGAIAPISAAGVDTSDLFPGHMRVFSTEGALYALPWTFDAECVFVRPVRWLMAGVGEIPEPWPTVLPEDVRSLREGDDWAFRRGTLSQAFGEDRIALSDEPVIPVALEAPTDGSIGLAMASEAGAGASELIRYLCGAEAQANFVRITPPVRPSVYQRGDVQAHIDAQVRAVVRETGARLVRESRCAGSEK